MTKSTAENIVTSMFMGGLVVALALRMIGYVGQDHTFIALAILTVGSSVAYLVIRHRFRDVSVEDSEEPLQRRRRGIEVYGLH